MSLFDAFRFDSKRALVVGGATGMGRAAAELLLDLGAEVVVMDYAAVDLEGAKGIHLNLAEKDSIDAAIDECGGPVHAILSCAGVDNDAPNVEKINFIGHRHLIERMIDEGMLGAGGAIAMISSAAGLGWEANMARNRDYLSTPDFDSAVAWVEQNGGKDYMSAKQAMCTYVAIKAYPFLKKGIRINAIAPGPTDTPRAQANPDMWLGFGADYRADVGVDANTPLEQAEVLVFLASDAARAINGVTIVTDMGYFSAGATGEFPAATETVNFMLGRF
jgi:NAD(P)-dependent dehydrogenase (short-subunit alcohol dehydrogenase family)